ncbi:MAG: type sorting protein [Chitinophagaceae bacterium]|nr:type sorting protein [Chitinophagaceae bacterium]
MKLIYLFRSLLLFLLLCFTGTFVQAQFPYAWNKKAISFATGSGFIAGTSDAGYYLDKSCSGKLFYKLNPTTDAWTAGPNMPVTCPVFAMGIGTKLYVGFNNGTYYYYDSADNLWHQLTNYSTSISPCGLAAGSYVNPAISINGQGYVIGPSDCSLSVFNVLKYDPAYDTWTIATTVPIANMDESYGALLFSLNGKLYTGFEDTNGNSDVWQWDPSLTLNSWHETAPFPISLSVGSIGYERCDGNAYVFGGGSDFSSNSPSAISKYNPTTDVWSPHGSMLNNANGEPLSFDEYASSFILNSKVYIMPMTANFVLESLPFVNLGITGISPTTICTKSTFNVPFTTDCKYNAGNVFTAQLSDATGSFSNPVNIGTLNSITQGTINATLPSVVAGTGYRIRVISSDPYRISPDNGIDLTIQKTVTNVSFSASPSLVYANDPAFTLTNATPAGGTFSGQGVSGGTTFTPSTAGVGTFPITYTYNSSCSNTALSTITVTCNDAVGGSWKQKANFLGAPRDYATSFSINNIGYVFGGQLFDELPTKEKDLWQYDPTTNAWTQKASLPAAAGARSKAFSFVIGTNAYVGGGQSSNNSTYFKDFWQYNPSTNAWVQKADFLGGDIAASSAFSIGNNGYVTSGILENGTLTSKIWKWNGTAWSLITVTGSKPSARYNAIGFSLGTKGYLCAGNNIANELNDLWEFNPATSAWTQKSNIPGLTRESAVASTTSTNAYVGLGAHFDGTNSNSLNDFYAYDPTTDAWTPMAAITSAPGGASTAFIAGNKLYVTTGYTSSPNSLWELTFCDPALSIDYTSSNIYCTGSSFILSASALGTFKTGNVFTAQLSDASGSFASPVNIGTYASAGLSSFSVTIPPSTIPGSNYRIRMLASNPAITSVTTSQAITISNCTIQTGALPNAPICAGVVRMPISFTANGFPPSSEFIIELSNATGSFAPSGTFLGSIIGTGSLSALADIPVNTTPGTGYRIRARQNQGTIVGTDNGTDLVIDNRCISLTFDGVDDRVTIPDHVAYQWGTGDFSVEAWVKLSAATPSTATVAVVSKRTTSYQGFLFGVVNGTQLIFQSSNPSPIYSNTISASIYDNACHYVAVSRTAGVVSFYVDGTSLGSFNENGSVSSTADMYFGSDVNGGLPLNGQINDVRIYNIGRTASQITGGRGSLAGTPVLGFYNFKEVALQTVIDGGSLGNNGYLGSTINVDVNDPSRTGVPCYQWDRLGATTNDEENTSTQKVNVNIHPNPFDGTITIESHGFSGSTLDIQITDLRGEVIGEYTVENKELIQLAPSVAQGMYILLVKDHANQSAYFKLIKN